LHALVAMDMPGPGTVFLSQNWKFTAPVYIGDTNPRALDPVGKPYEGELFGCADCEVSTIPPTIRVAPMR
jgi:hypothetical protein